MPDITIPIHTGKADPSYLRSLTDTLKQIQSKMKTLEADVEETQSASFVSNASLILPPTLTNSSTAAGTKLLSLNTSYAIFFGKTPKDITSLSVLWKVTNPLLPDWAEMGVYTGDINLGGNSTLTRKWWVNILSSISPAGVKKTTITGPTIPMGSDIWVVWSIGTGGSAPTVRAFSALDDIQSGVQATVTGHRPSSTVAPTVFTVEAATAAPPWCAIKV